jgi:hypothetical protein
LFIASAQKERTARPQRIAELEGLWQNTLTQAMAASGFLSMLPQRARPNLIGRRLAGADKDPARSLSLLYWLKQRSHLSAICGRGRNCSVTPSTERINRGIAEASRPSKATPKISR